MHIKKLLLSAAAILLLALLAPVTPAGGEQATQCTVVIPAVAVEPGLSTEPNSGVFYSDGETGTIDCGDEKGTIGIVRGRYGTTDPDSCQDGGEFWGVFSYRLGGQAIRDSFTGDYGPNTERRDAGRIQGERLSGTYSFTGTEGNCVTAPITRGDIRMKATYKG
jgi:hypothetical protein